MSVLCSTAAFDGCPLPWTLRHCASQPACLFSRHRRNVSHTTVGIQHYFTLHNNNALQQKALASLILFDGLREAFQKKPKNFLTNVKIRGGGVWSGSMSKEKNIVSKSFLSNFKQF